MKKKNLAVLLIIPFLISLLGVVVADVTYSFIDVDISSIVWEYDDVEFFQIDIGEYVLQAEGITPTGYPAGEGNELVWTVEDKVAAEDGSKNNHAVIINRGEEYYLEPLTEGEITLTCSNAKGNVFRRLDAVVFKDGAIAIAPTVSASQSNVDSNIYYGQYDISRVGGVTKTAAKIGYTVKVVPEDLSSNVLLTCSQNVTVTGTTAGEISITGTGEAFVTAEILGKDNIAKSSFNFNIVEGGVNVYSYDDLMYCTNDSTNGGEIVVLRRSFESAQALYQMDENGYVKIQNGAPVVKKDTNGKVTALDAECFGNINGLPGGQMQFDFSVEYVPTTYNSEYIKQWNEFAGTSSKYDIIDAQIAVGLYVTKDFYGNGYTVNMHNLCYPYNSSGQIEGLSELASYNIFKGPLPYYALGDPNGTPLVTAFGQDNAGVYVYGDNITINDVSFKNCDEVNMAKNLDYVGTVLEVDGDNNVVKNCVLSNGKNVVRSFSSFNLTLQNCILQNSRNFLFVTGANEYEQVDPTKQANFITVEGRTVRDTLANYIDERNAGNGNGVLNTFVQQDDTSFDKETMRSAMHSIQNALDYEDAESLREAGSSTIIDCKFLYCGIASVCFESIFNGPFLYNGTPSYVSSTLTGLLKELIPMMPTNVGGTSHPVSVSLVGDTVFNEYKNVEDWDISGLISENMSPIANDLLQSSVTIDIDRIFPLKSILKNKAGSIYSKGGKINVAVAYYGGGLNHSTLYTDNLNCKADMSGEIEVDLLDEYLSYRNSMSILGISPELMLKTVTTVTGTNPFKFRLMV